MGTTTTSEWRTGSGQGGGSREEARPFTSQRRVSHVRRVPPGLTVTLRPGLPKVELSPRKRVTSGRKTEWGGADKGSTAKGAAACLRGVRRAVARARKRAQGRRARAGA